MSADSRQHTSSGVGHRWNAGIVRTCSGPVPRLGEWRPPSPPHDRHSITTERPGGSGATRGRRRRRGERGQWRRPAGRGGGVLGDLDVRSRWEAGGERGRNHGIGTPQRAIPFLVSTRTVTEYHGLPNRWSSPHGAAPVVASRHLFRPHKLPIHLRAEHEAAMSTSDIGRRGRSCRLDVNPTDWRGGRAVLYNILISL